MYITAFIDNFFVIMQQHLHFVMVSVSVVGEETLIEIIHKITHPLSYR